MRKGEGWNDQNGPKRCVSRCLSPKWVFFSFSLYYLILTNILIHLLIVNYKIASRKRLEARDASHLELLVNHHHQWQITFNGGWRCDVSPAPGMFFFFFFFHSMFINCTHGCHITTAPAVPRGDDGHSHHSAQTWEAQQVTLASITVLTPLLGSFCFISKMTAFFPGYYLFYLLATLLRYEWCWVPPWNISVYFIN